MSSDEDSPSSHDDNHNPLPGTPPSIGWTIRHAQAPPPASQHRVTSRAMVDEDGDHRLPAMRSRNYLERNPIQTSLPISPSPVAATAASASAAGRRRDGETAMYGSLTSKQVNLEDDDNSWAPGTPSATAGGSISVGMSSARLPIPPTAAIYRTSFPSPGYRQHNSDNHTDYGRGKLPVLNPNRNSGQLITNIGDGMSKGHCTTNGIANQYVGHHEALVLLIEVEHPF